MIRDPTGRESRLAAMLDLLPLLLGVAVLWMLRGITGSVRAGDPFIAANARRLRAIGGLLIVGGLAVYFAQGALEEELLAGYGRAAGAPRATPGLLPADHEWPDYPLLGGLFILVLAQVFAHGTRLREDVAATI